MKCNKCGSECPDGNIFCESCGSELESPMLPDNIDDKGRMRKKRAKKEKNTAADKAAKKQLTSDQRERIQKKMKSASICILVILIILAIVFIVGLIKSNSGFKSANKIALGRNVEYISSETGLVFEKKTTNGLINSMADYDYICVSEETIKLNGSEHPQWIILLTTGAEDMISDVEYYDFRKLKNNWKGKKMPERLDQNTVEFGMSLKNLNKAVGLEPYYVKRSVSNDSIYCYRYFCTDEASNYDKVYNYYVEFSDVDSTVKNVHYSEINYAETIFSAAEKKADVFEDPEELPEEPAEDEELSDEVSDEETAE